MKLRRLVDRYSLCFSDYQNSFLYPAALHQIHRGECGDLCLWPGRWQFRRSKFRVPYLRFVRVPAESFHQCGRPVLPGFAKAAEGQVRGIALSLAVNGGRFLLFRPVSDGHILLDCRFVPRTVDKWLRSIVGQVMKQRRETNASRNDFLQGIMSHQRNGQGRYYK